MATLLASNEMGIIQMRMTRAQAVDMLDRYNEAVKVMVPVWRLSGIFSSRLMRYVTISASSEICIRPAPRLQKKLSQLKGRRPMQCAGYWEITPADLEGVEQPFIGRLSVDSAGTVRDTDDEFVKKPAGRSRSRPRSGRL